MIKRSIGLSLLGSIILSVCCAEPLPTSENNNQLLSVLQNFPSADTDGDEILTLTEANAFLASDDAMPGRRGPKKTLYIPTPEEILEKSALGESLNADRGPLAHSQGNGLRVLIIGHSWVAPGRLTLPGIAAAGGFSDHHQRSHHSGGGTGAANAIWTKEFGDWKPDEPANPILLPAILTGEWDVMTWGAYYGDIAPYFTQWIDLCLAHNPDMVFYIQDGWPRFNPGWAGLPPQQISPRIIAQHRQIQERLLRPIYNELEKAYPGKVRVIPAGPAVVDLMLQHLGGQLEHIDCMDEKSQGGSSGVLRDGGHLSRKSGIEHLIGYLYYGMLYRQSPELIADYTPEGIPAEFDQHMREVAWRAIVESPFAGIDDADQDGLADN